jgi:CRISPR system Cascade subunit CasD
MSVLLLRLAGPMQAWGTQSRFGVRDTGLEPSKSGVIGLLCAALGKPRAEKPDDGFPTLEELGKLLLAVRVDRPGTMAADYHTAKDIVIASSEPGKKPKLKECELSNRYYLADADFLVGLQGPLELLQRLDAAIARPVWPLYLGRKSFVPAMSVRVDGGLLTDATLPGALKTQPWWWRTPRDWPTPNEPNKPKEPPTLRIVMETDYAADGEARNDVPLNFLSRERAFLTRRVHDVEFWRVSPEDLIQRWPPCSSRN